MKFQRHNAIRDLVGSSPVSNQDELRRKLRRRGFEVTQATLSRDIHELRLSKGPGGYVLPNRNGNGHGTAVEDDGPPSVAEMIESFCLRVQQAMNQVVVGTVMGGAQPFAAALDHEGWPERAECEARGCPGRPGWAESGPWSGGRRSRPSAAAAGLLLLALIAVAAMGTPMAFSTHHELSPYLPHAIIGIVAYVTFLFSAQAPLGFQADYERMDLLKSLPIRPLAMACGQTLVVVMVLTLLDWSVFAVTVVFLPAAAAEMLAAGLFALPFNWIFCGTENLLFLLYPSPRVATGSEGFLKMGRMVLFMLAKFLVLGACVALAAIPAAVVYLLTWSIPAACLAGWLASLPPAVGILLMVARAFQRYDVSVGGAE